MLLVVALVTVLRTAWLSDDALITVRCVLNTLHGYGPNFNIDERVQAYTHPLWFVLATMATALSGNPWFALLALSLAAAAIALRLLFFRIGGATSAGLIACCTVLLSKAYIDYSTSGLETPLTNVLMRSARA